MALYVPENPCERYNDAGGGQCVWAHMAVAAVSDQVLRRCHVRLVRVQQAVAGRWATDPRFAAPIRLKWAFAGLNHPDVEYRDIRPGEPALLDIVYTLERMPGRAYIESLDTQPIGLPRDLAPSVYLVTVRALAEERDPVDCTVMLGVQETWTGLTISVYNATPEDI
jgi:hypothetical protein